MTSYPVPDRSDKRPRFTRTPEDDRLDIGWSEGILTDGRPYRTESWCQDQVMLLTVFFSALGLEAASNPDLADLLVREQLLRFTGAARHVAGVRFVDPSGHELWAVNVVIGDEDDTFVEDRVPVWPYARGAEPPAGPGPGPEARP
jgi:hypothetical protein